MCILKQHYAIYVRFVHTIGLSPSAYDFLCLFHLGCPIIIPDIQAEYVEVKATFVKVCTEQGTPTLDDVKNYCLDLIECSLKNVPRASRYEDDIEGAETLQKLARIMCFQLSTWISYDFFNKVIAHFQPALKAVKEQMMRYGVKLKDLLEEKLENVAEIQQKWVMKKPW